MSHPYWSGHFARVNAKRMATMMEVLKARLLPSFDGIEDEANAKVDETWEAISSMSVGEYGPLIDESEAAEMAQDAGREHYSAMSDARQTLINSFAITLYHLWEQQVLSFHRRQVLGFHEPHTAKLLSLKVFTERLLEIGVDIKSFRSWSVLSVYRCLANTIKHADGDSADELKKLRPEWFIPRSFRDDPLGEVFRYEPKVYEPLAGEDVYVDVDDLDEFVKATSLFWGELVAALASIN
ncbi:MAG: hypothetical protein Q8Q98_09200 [Polaromonas sp.]|nr:hypothetical protein [Polaromonas sp.]